MSGPRESTQPPGALPGESTLRDMRHAATYLIAHDATGQDAPQLGEVEAADCHLRVTAWTLSRDCAARRVRVLLRSQLEGYITDPAVLRELEVVVCELATNAGKHTEGPCEMRIVHHDGVPVVCEIADAGCGLREVIEHLHTRGPEDLDELDALGGVVGLAESGRGLQIVASLTAGCCGAHTTRLCSTGLPGKSVWFQIPAPARP